MLETSKELREKILIEPVQQGADNLRIISGYAAHTMVSWHISEIWERFRKTININLTVGMCIRDMLFKAVHDGFKEIMKMDTGILNQVLSVNT